MFCGRIWLRMGNRTVTELPAAFPRGHEKQDHLSAGMTVLQKPFWTSTRRGQRLSSVLSGRALTELGVHIADVGGEPITNQ
jgi:hypothetical protein